jgi:hypothetical protein
MKKIFAAFFAFLLTTGATSMVEADAGTPLMWSSLLSL